jgi:HipA-like protein
MARPGTNAFALGAVIRDARAARGWTQGHRAARAGVSLGFVIGIERGARVTHLSLSMPPARTPYPSRYIEMYLRGLLPDNDDVCQRWTDHFGLRDRDAFGLIACDGADCAGGAVFLPVWTQPRPATSSSRTDPRSS